MYNKNAQLKGVEEIFQFNIYSGFSAIDVYNTLIFFKVICKGMFLRITS